MKTQPYYRTHIFSILGVILLTLLLANPAHALTLNAKVDRDNLSLNDTLLLTVTLDQQGADTIDFSRVGIQFDILNNQRSSHTSIVNGRISSQTEWSLVLAPKEPGTLVIPSFSVNGVFSDAITVNVTDSPSNQEAQKNNADLFLSSTVSKNNPYVQEQLLLTLRLYYRVSLSGYTANDLNIPNATIELISENNFQTKHQNQTYNVLEKVYAIHPQASGPLTIPKQIWQLEKAQRSFGFNRNSSPYLRVNSDELRIEVLPIPAASTAKQWLPATELTLNQQWQQSTISAKVGEPLNYRLFTRASGLSHSQLPAIDIPSTDAFTVYTDQPQTENKKNDQGITGERTQNYAIIPKKTGQFTLPPIQLKWWNVKTNREETIQLKQQQVIVAASELGNDALPDNTASASTNTSKNTANQTSNNTDVQNQGSSTPWKISTLILAISTFLFFILWRSSSKQKKLLTSKEKLQSSKPRVLKSHYQAIEKAINNQQWPALKSALLQWGSAKVDNPVKNSSELTDLYPELAEQLHILDQLLYKPNQVLVWDFKTPPNDLLSLLKKQKLNTSSRAKTEADKLAPLYPS